MNIQKIVSTIVLTMSLGCLIGSCDSSFNKAGSSKVKIIGGNRIDRPVYFLGLGANSFGCGASYLGDRWAITAAHCVVGGVKSKLSVSWGNSEDEISQKSAEVLAVFPHEDFNEGTLNNDIALLYLSDNIEREPSVKPIKYFEDDNSVPEVGSDVTVIGRGNTTSSGNMYFNQIRKIDLQVLSNEYCTSRPSVYGVDPDLQFCASKNIEEGGYASCQGDSGGPVVVNNEDGSFGLVGLVSWGIGCGQKEKPDYYTRISAFRSWIETTRKSFESGELDLLKRYDSHCYQDELTLSQESEAQHGIVKAFYKKNGAKREIQGEVEGLQNGTISQCDFTYGNSDYSLQGYLYERYSMIYKLADSFSTRYYLARIYLSGLQLITSDKSTLNIDLDDEPYIEDEQSGQSYYVYFEGDMSHIEKFESFTTDDFQVKYGYSHNKDIMYVLIQYRNVNLVEGFFKKSTYNGSRFVQVSFDKILESKIEASIVAPYYYDVHTWQLSCTQEFGVVIDGETIWSNPLRGGKLTSTKSYWEVTRESWKDKGANILKGTKLHIDIVPKNSSLQEGFLCNINDKKFSDY